MQNYALTSPKPQMYIEKAPICSKTDFWPCGGRRPESDSSSLKTMPIHHLNHKRA